MNLPPDNHSNPVSCKWLNYFIVPSVTYSSGRSRKGETTSTEVQFSSVTQSCTTLRPHESQHARPPCPSPAPGVYSNSCPSSRWCHPSISSSVAPFFSCPQSLPASGSFPMSQLFSWGGQSTGVSASALVLPMNTQDGSRSPLFRQGWATVGLMTRLSTRGIREASYLKGHLWKR